MHLARRCWQGRQPTRRDVSPGSSSQSSSRGPEVQHGGVTDTRGTCACACHHIDGFVPTSVRCRVCIQELKVACWGEEKVGSRKTSWGPNGKDLSAVEICGKRSTGVVPGSRLTRTAPWESLLSLLGTLVPSKVDDKAGAHVWALALPHGSFQDNARLHHPRKSVCRRWASCHRPKDGQASWCTQ